MIVRTDVTQLDDTALLMQRQEAADTGNHARKRELDVEVKRRWYFDAPETNVLMTRDGVYPQSESGAFCDGEWYGKRLELPT